MASAIRSSSMSMLVLATDTTIHQEVYTGLDQDRSLAAHWAPTAATKGATPGLADDAPRRSRAPNRDVPRDPWTMIDIPSTRDGLRKDR